MHEFLSIEIHVWPLTGPMSCLIDHSNAQASSKNGIGKLMVRSVLPPIPALISDGGEVFVAVVSDLEEAGRSFYFSTHRFADTLFILLPGATLPQRFSHSLKSSEIAMHLCNLFIICLRIY